MSVTHRWLVTLASCSTAIAAALCIASSASAVVTYVNDSFRDGTRTDPASPTYSEDGTDSDADGDVEAAWFFTGGVGSSMTVVNPLGIGNPGYLQTTMAPNTGGSSHLITYFRPRGYASDAGAKRHS